MQKFASSVQNSTAKAFGTANKANKATQPIKLIDQNVPCANSPLLNLPVPNLSMPKVTNVTNVTNTTNTTNTPRQLVGASLLLFSITNDGTDVPCILLARDGLARWSGNKSHVFTDFGGAVDRLQVKHVKALRSHKHQIQKTHQVEEEENTQDLDNFETHANHDSKDIQCAQDNQDSQDNQRYAVEKPETVAAREFVEESLVGCVRYFGDACLNTIDKLQANVEQSLMRNEYFAKIETPIGKNRVYVTFVKQVPFQKHVRHVFKRQRQLLQRSTTMDYVKMTQEQRQY